MNISIITDNGSIKRYCVDFKPCETSVAIDAMRRLRSDKTIEADSAKQDNETLTYQPIINFNNRKNTLKFTEDTFKVFETFFKPTPYKALSTDKNMYWTYNNVKKRLTISKPKLDEWAKKFGIEYKIDPEGFILITNPPEFKNAGSFVDKKTLKSLLPKDISADVRRRIEEEYYVDYETALAMAASCKTIEDCNRFIKKRETLSASPMTQENTVVR